jgi:hypothetical protein
VRKKGLFFAAMAKKENARQRFLPRFSLGSSAKKGPQSGRSLFARRHFS